MKFLFFLITLLFLNGCVQNSALLGPMYTLGTTGNVIQAGASYGTSYVVKKVANINISEEINKTLKANEVSVETKKTNIKTQENPEEIFRIVKKHIKKLDKVDNFTQ